jgi:regulator of sigma E protease
MTYLIALALLSFLNVVHEAGHLLAARLVGIPAAEFSVGLGPRLWSRRWRGTEYALRAIPLGGFVVPALDEADFRSVPFRRRLLFFLGGPLANFAAAVPLFAAYNATHSALTIYNLFIAPWGQAARFCSSTLASLPGLFGRPDMVNGVVGIVVGGGHILLDGRGLELALSLTVSLALLNLLPIPVLDGGQILLGCLEEISPRFLAWRVPLTVLGLAVLALVMIYANVQDVLRLLGIAG